MNKKKKIEWLSVLQGWSMLLVVFGHITLTNMFKDPQYPLSALLEKIIYSFHMPLFMFISGYLFHLTRIGKNKDYIAIIIDKLKRLGIPFLFFTLLTIIPKVIFAPVMKNPIILEFDYFTDVFILYKINPLGEMWFIISLFILILFYPLYRWALKRTSTIWFSTLIIFLLYWLNPNNIHIFQLSNVMKFAIFFWGGILISHFQVIYYLQNRISFIITSLFFAIAEISTSNQLITSILGIIFSLALCLQLSKRYPHLFSSFRNYTYQIFLMGIFFQMGVRYLFMYLHNSIWYIPCYILSIILGIYCPVLIAKGIKKINIPLINLCFGLN